jgi:hypothetical protein
MLVIRNKEHFSRVYAFAAKTNQLQHLFQILNYLNWFADPRVTEKPVEYLSGPLDIDDLQERFASRAKHECETVLERDFAPASFIATCFKQEAPGAPFDRRYYTIGVIYHGDQTGWSDKDVYEDPLTIRIGDDDNPWGLHS